VHTQQQTIRGIYVPVLTRVDQAPLLSSTLRKTSAARPASATQPHGLMRLQQTPLMPPLTHPSSSCLWSSCCPSAFSAAAMMRTAVKRMTTAPAAPTAAAYRVYGQAQTAAALGSLEARSHQRWRQATVHCSWRNSGSTGAAPGRAAAGGRSAAGCGANCSGSSRRRRLQRLWRSRGGAIRQTALACAAFPAAHICRTFTRALPSSNSSPAGLRPACSRSLVAQHRCLAQVLLAGAAAAASTHHRYPQQQ